MNPAAADPGPERRGIRHGRSGSQAWHGITAVLLVLLLAGCGSRTDQAAIDEPEQAEPPWVQDPEQVEHMQGNLVANMFLFLAVKLYKAEWPGIRVSREAGRHTTEPPDLQQIWIYPQELERPVFVLVGEDRYRVAPNDTDPRLADPGHPDVQVYVEDDGQISLIILQGMRHQSPVPMGVGIGDAQIWVPFPYEQIRDALGLPTRKYWTYFMT